MCCFTKPFTFKKAGRRFHLSCEIEISSPERFCKTENIHMTSLSREDQDIQEQKLRIERFFGHHHVLHSTLRFMSHNEAKVTINSYLWRHTRNTNSSFVPSQYQWGLSKIFHGRKAPKERQNPGHFRFGNYSLKRKCYISLFGFLLRSR